MSQRVIITAAASGIGQAIAKAFHNAGAQVHVCDVDDKAIDELAKDIPEISRAVVDVSDEKSLSDWFAAATGAMGGIDVLVNNAGVGGEGLSLEDVTPEIFDRVFDVHVKGAFLLTRAVVPGMKQQRYGKIINITSVFAMGGSAFASHYAAAKSALTGLTKSWARELAPFNIMVNAVAPGVLETDMTLNSIGKDRIGVLAKDIPLGRMAKPIDISYAVAWLASPETDMLTGQVISPNGGAAIVGI